MGSGQAHRAADAAASHLTPGEQVTATGFGSMGRVSLGKNLALAIVVGIVSAGTVIASRRPRKAYYALTNQRLLAFDGEGMFGRPGKLLFALPLQTAKIARSSKNFLGFVRVDLAVEGQPKGLRVAFASGSQQAGEAVIAAIKSAGGVYASEAITAGPATDQAGFGGPQAGYAAPQAGYAAPRAGSYGSPQPDYSSSQAGHGAPQSSSGSASPWEKFDDPWKNWDGNPQQAQPGERAQQSWDRQPQQNWAAGSQSAAPQYGAPQPGVSQQPPIQQPRERQSPPGWDQQPRQDQGGSRQSRGGRDDRPTEEWRRPADW